MNIATLTQLLNLFELTLNWFELSNDSIVTSRGDLYLN